MKYLASLIVELIARNRDLRKPAERRRIGIIESWVSLLGNTILTLLKLFFGIMTSSLALIADAVHSASDIFSSLVVLIGFIMAGKKADSEHPHGHGRTEYLAGLIIGVMLVGAGGSFIYSASSRLSENIIASPSIASMIMIIVVIILKELMYHFSIHLGQMIDSDALKGDAWHHRSDSLSSGLVLVALAGGYFGFHALDTLFGIAIAFFLIYTGLKIMHRSYNKLLGAAPNSELKQGIVNCAMEIKGVMDAHRLEVHDYGSWKVITIHVVVSGYLSLDEAHEIAQTVEDHVSSKYHCNAIVHLDPAKEHSAQS